MPLKIVSNELVSLLNINLKYLSTETDTYDNVISYFVIGNTCFNNSVESIPDNSKMSYWKGEHNLVMEVNISEFDVN